MSEYLQFAAETAKAAGQLLLDNYGKMHSLEWKIRTDFKTEVDDQSDALIRHAILARYPDHNIYSEESSDRETHSAYSWVVDPLGGTIPYTYGVNIQFSVCIGLVRGKDPIMGVIYSPKLNNFYTAEVGAGAFCNDVRLHVSNETDINKVLMGINLGKKKRVEGVPYLKRLVATDGVAEIFSSGCYSVAQCLVASGKLQGYLGNCIEPWDMVAATVILREAGGKVTDLHGREWELGAESMLTANPLLHQKLMEFLGLGVNSV